MSKQITIMGVRYPSIAKACETYGIPPRVVYCRVYSLNWDLEVAITTPVRSHTRAVFFEGKLYKSLREVSTAYGIGHQRLIHRLHDGWSLEDAITTPVSPVKSTRGTRVYVRGVYYQSISRAAESYDIAPGTVYARVRNGWSIEDAITTPVKRPRIDKWVKF